MSAPRGRAVRRGLQFGAAVGTGEVRAVAARPVRREAQRPQVCAQRQRALLRAGWTLRDAFASRWSDDAVRAALDLGTP